MSVLLLLSDADLEMFPSPPLLALFAPRLPSMSAIEDGVPGWPLQVQVPDAF